MKRSPQPQTQECQGSALPPVSVILAVYNGERYLSEAVRSILAQTHSRFEFIIVDDGSTDETPHLLADFARHDSRIRVVTQKNQDQPNSLNTALRLARHDWVAVIDHDDVSLPHRLETQLRALVAQPEIRVLGSYAIEMTAEGTDIRLRQASPTTIEEYRILRATGQWVGMVHPSILMHRQTILALGGYDPNFGAAADSELWSRVADDHVILSLPIPLVRYRVHNESMSFSRYYEQRHAMRWLRARQNARWRHETPPSREDFLRGQRGMRTWRRVNYRRQDLVHLFNWRARLAQVHGKQARATGWHLVGLLLSPKRATRFIWRRVKPS